MKQRRTEKHTFKTYKLNSKVIFCKEHLSYKFPEI
jgi:hypothetical protein